MTAVIAKMTSPRKRKKVLKKTSISYSIMTTRFHKYNKKFKKLMLVETNIDTDTRIDTVFKLQKYNLQMNTQSMLMTPDEDASVDSVDIDNCKKLVEARYIVLYALERYRPKKEEPTTEYARASKLLQDKHLTWSVFTEADLI